MNTLTMFKLYNYDTNNIRIVEDDSDITFYTKKNLQVSASGGKVVLSYSDTGTVILNESFENIHTPDYPTIDEYIVAIRGWLDEYLDPTAIEIDPYEIPLTAFGELPTADKSAYIQASGTYNLVPSNFREYTSLSGSTGVSSNMFYASTGTTVYGYGAIQSFRSLNHKSGQGGIAIINAMFPDNVANSWIGAGLVNLSDELSFGYNGTDFGIWHRNGGVAECRTITVTGASGGSTDLTLTLNSVAYTIPLTSGTTAHNAYQISTWLNSNQSVWVADQIDSTVIIVAQSDGAKSGTYSYSHATSTGTITQNTAGVTKTSDHIKQSLWNKNTMSSLDPSKGNVYKIEYQDSGFGDVFFYVADSSSGRFVLVHVLKYINSSTGVNLTQPSLRFGMYVASVGSTTNVSVKVASVGLFVQGSVSKIRNPRAVKNTQTISTSLTNIITLRNRRTYNYVYNQVEIDPLNLNISSESNKNIEVEVRTNPTFSGDTNFTNAGTNLVSDVDTTANTVSGGTLIAAFTVSPSGSRDVNLSVLDIVVPPSLRLCIAAKVTGGGASAAATATLTYYEDI